MNAFSQAVLFLFAVIFVEMTIIAPHEVLPLHKYSDPGYCAAPGVVRPHLRPESGRPVYPASAIRWNEEGATIVDFLIDKNGTVRDVNTPRSSGYSALDEAARTAVLSQRYDPAMFRGRAVACRKIERVVWKLTDDVSGGSGNKAPPFLNIRNMGRADYPPFAAARGEHGDTKIIVIIDEAGKIVHSQISQSSGFNDLDTAALTAMYAGPKITPASISGKPIRTVAFFDFNWSLAGQSQPPVKH